MLDVKVRSDNFLSVKDESGELNIADRVWDSMFDFLSNRTNFYYFLGERFNYIDEEFDSNLQFLSESILCKTNISIITQLKPSSLILNRARLAKFWSYYESPAIIFLKDLSQEPLIVKNYSGKIKYVDFNNRFISSYMIYQSFELDVLWIKTSDMEFPVHDLLDCR